jgi:hypothetical protein
MLEDHSPTSRSNARKPFRRKGGKSVIFNTSCVYYQLEPADDSSGAEEGEGDREEPIAGAQGNGLEKPASEVENHLEENAAKPKAHQNPEILVEELYNVIDQPHDSPRIDNETVDVTGTSVFLNAS